MDRMKQIIATEQAADDYDMPVMLERPQRYYREQALPDDLPLVYKERLDDPEYVWKSQEQSRWSQLERQTARSGPRSSREELKPPSVRQIWLKLGVSAVLFAAVWGMFHLDHPAAQRGQGWVRAALQRDFDFRAAAVWYEHRFGGLPAFLPALGGSKADPEAQKAGSSSLQRLYAPVHGKITGKSDDGEQGITIRTEPEAAVAAIDTGRVIAVTTGTDRATEIVIQHAGGLQSKYGWIIGSTLKQYDWVEGGETIGKVTTDAAGGAGKLYIAVKKDNQYVVPTDVIAFD
jgi:stage IV sporulation protein FA